jgi:septal ring factor EnvC (AmiA/AmiB activator)
LVESLRSHQVRLEHSLTERTSDLHRLRQNITEQEDTIFSLQTRLTRTEQALRERDSLYCQRLEEVEKLRLEIARLERECAYLRGCVEKGLENVRRNNEARDAPIRAPAASPLLSAPHLPEHLRLNRPTEQTRRPSRQPGFHSEQRPEYDVRTQASFGEESAKTARFIDVGLKSSTSLPHY